jgi:hypothetical protein
MRRTLDFLAQVLTSEENRVLCNWWSLLNQSCEDSSLFDPGIRRNECLDTTAWSQISQNLKGREDSRLFDPTSENRILIPFNETNSSCEDSHFFDPAQKTKFNQLTHYCCFARIKTRVARTPAFNVRRKNKCVPSYTTIWSKLNQNKIKSCEDSRTP